MASAHKSDDLAPGNETVFTVNDYYDGPLKGIANFQGKPHFYERIFDSASDDYSDMYRLTPIDEPTFRLAMEDWEIWCRWEVAFHTGKAKSESHPALPQDAVRHEELNISSTGRCRVVPRQSFKQGSFPFWENQRCLVARESSK